MKYFPTGAVIALALAACSPPPANEAAPPQVAATAVQAKAIGEVVVLQPEFGAVTIRHEAIPEFGMGAMTMEFTTADAKQLAGIKVGDKVTFELSGPTEIEKIDVMK
jgi:Cu/Ag efflux protein CusF